MRNIAVIAARSGSKGLPGKNMRPLLGLPLIQWTAYQATNAGIFDEVIVSSDSPEISKSAEKFGVKYLFDRPLELSTDSATSVDVVLHAIDILGVSDDCSVTLLECTSPIRKQDDIRNTVFSLINNQDKFDASISFCKVKQHPAVMFKKFKSNLHPLGLVPQKMVRRQDFDEVFHPFGGIYCIKVEALRKFKTFYPLKLTGFELEEFQAFEVDDLGDFICVEAIVNYYSNRVFTPC